MFQIQEKPEMNGLTKILISDGATLRGCFYELDEAVQNNCLSDTRGLSCAVCENVNGVSGCNRGVNHNYLY